MKKLILKIKLFFTRNRTEEEKAAKSKRNMKKNKKDASIYPMF